MKALFPPYLGIDGYKLEHHRQYPDGTEVVFSNLTPRYSRRNVDHVVYFGGQYFIKRILIELWNTEFFEKPKEEVLLKFQRYINAYAGKDNRVGIHHIASLHDLGFLPIKIMSLPEGSIYPIRVPCLVIFNTNPDFYWLTNFLETILSNNIWPMCTSATTAKIYYDLLASYAMETVGDTSFVQFQGHDFSFRGLFGSEAGVMSAASHATSFVGTDTVPVLPFMEDWYGANVDNELIGCSIPATEHSVMCAGGKDDELETFRRLIEDLYPDGFLSVVSDTWDFWKVVNPKDGLLVQLKGKIMARNGKLVIRPDTGDPIKIVCGEAKPVADSTIDNIRTALSEGYTHIRVDDKYYHMKTGGSMGVALELVPEELVTPEMKGAIQCLYEIFGGSMTSKGYKLLDQHIGLIYGDSITIARAHAICQQLKDMGFASINIVFGIGSYTYAYVTRDTDGYAIKATWVRINGVAREIFKEPKTGDGTKNSAKGLIAVYKDSAGEFYMKDQVTWNEVLNCEFQPVFEDGKLVKEETLNKIRERLRKY